MPQHDMNIANDSGSNVRTDFNNALAAIVQAHSGATEPGTMFAHQIWADTSPTGNSIFKVRDAANATWATLFDDEGRWKGVDGTAAEPSMSFGSDTDTGLYRIGANQIGIATGGTLAMTVDASQNTTLVGTLTSNSDADGTTILGRAKIASVAGDDAAFGHFDWVATDAAVSQSNSGVTTIDCETTGGVLIKAGGTNVITCVSTPATTFAGPLGGTGSISFGGGGSSHRLDGKIGINRGALANMVAGDMVLSGSLALQEITTPTADVNFAKIYTKIDNKLYFQDGAGVEHTVTIS